MNNQILSVIYAFLGSSLVNLAQAIQKIGMDSPAEKKLRKWTPTIRVVKIPSGLFLFSL